MSQPITVTRVTSRAGLSTNQRNRMYRNIRDRVQPSPAVVTSIVSGRRVAGTRGRM